MQETDNHTKMTQFRKMPKFHTNICTNFHRLRKIRNETSKYLNLFLQSLHLTSFLLSDLWRGEKRTFKIKSKFWQNESDRLRLRQAVNLLVTWTLFFESFCLKLHSSWKYFLSVELCTVQHLYFALNATIMKKLNSILYN